MSGWMTFGLKRFESLEVTMRELIPPLSRSTEELMKLMDMSHNENMVGCLVLQFPLHIDSTCLNLRLHGLNLPGLSFVSTSVAFL